MKRTFCDVCHREALPAKYRELEVPYELMEFDLCNDCVEELSYSITE